MTRILLSSIFLMFSLFSANAETPKLSINISDYTLENGLRLVVIPDRRAPVVTHMIWYKVGAADDPPGKSGLAHYLEHLMFKGTSNTPPGEFSKAIASIGGQENAFTSYDYTAYYQKVAPQALPEMMEYEADRIRNLVLSEEVVLPEREVILEERSGRVDNNPGAILSEFSRAALFVHHPYGIPVIGWEHEIRQLSREDVLAFYENWYQPWNAIVVVAGDVDAEAVLEMAKETYGKVEASIPPVDRNRLADPQAVANKTVEYSDDRVTNPSWRKTFLVPSYRLSENGEAAALDLLAAILGDSVSSRIYQNVVLEQKLATSAGAYYQGSSRDMSTFGFYATPRDGTDLSEVSSAVETELRKILEEGVTQEELDRARETYLRSLIYSQDSQVTLARIFGSILSTGGSIQDFLDWPDELSKVTVEQVNQVARKYLNENPSVISKLLPEQG